jgi:hypothetical protein
MRSLLTVSSPAADLTLLSIEEMRTAAGITGTGSDTQLRAMEKFVAATIMTECDIAVAPGYPPTLRRESLVQTIYQACGEVLVLARRHDIVISSIVEDGVTLLDTDFIVDPETGELSKLCNDYPAWWSARKVVIEFAAGFETVPEDLKGAATEYFRASWIEKSRDPLVKMERINIPDVREVERQFWVGSVPGQSSEGAVPDVVVGKLARFSNASHG